MHLHNYFTAQALEAHRLAERDAYALDCAAADELVDVSVLLAASTNVRVEHGRDGALCVHAGTGQA